MAAYPGALAGGRVGAERADARAEDVRFLAEQGATLEEVVTRGGFPSKDALWVFCKRRGMRELYMSLPRAPWKRMDTSRYRVA